MNDDRQAKIEQLIDKKLTRLGRSGRDVNYLCPWCEKKGESHKLHIDYGKQKGVCHGCGYGFQTFDWFLTALFNGIPSKIARWLNRPDLSVDVRKLLESPSESDSLQPASLPDSFVPLPRRPRDDLGRAMLRYVIHTRGYTYADVERWGAGYVVDERDKAHGYLILPYYVGGRVVYWQGRRVCPNRHNWRGERWREDGPPKNWNPPGSFKKAILYGFDQAVGQRTLFLCEGPFDAWSWGAGGLALTSKVIHDPQARALALLGAERLIVCMDGDAKGDTESIYEQLHDYLTGVRVGRLFLKQGDPDDHRGRIRHIAKQRTVWGRRLDTVGKVREILRSDS